MNPGRVRPVVAVVRAAVVAEGDAGSMVDFPMVTDVSVALGFDEVYAREYPALVAVASALIGHREDAQDLVHDTMVRALMRWERVSRLERPGAWCHHVLVNACRSRLRRRATEWRYLSRLRRTEAITPEPSTDTVAFWLAVRTLPARPRSVVALYFAAELTSVQIGEVLNVPEGTVRSDLAMARRVVMAALRGDTRE